jgi:bidirectional [NiFe] hydrogenase diaphorase subunit
VSSGNEPKAPITITLDGRTLTCEKGQTVLDVCRKNDVDLPLLCAFEGLSLSGACRLCLVEVEGLSKLLPACTTPVTPNQVIRTDTDRLRTYRRMTMELFFAEGNHVCAVCVANGACELQDLAARAGMDRVRFPYLYPRRALDASHRLYVLDHNRCVLCTRCVRVCDEVEGAHNWDVKGRGDRCAIISDFDRPWGDSATCTDCGKCVDVCPTGALWSKSSTQGSARKDPLFVSELILKRRPVPTPDGKA